MLHESIMDNNVWIDVDLIHKCSKAEALDLKKKLYKMLQEQNCFWSYDMSSVDIIPDDKIILNTLIHLDLPEINLLFMIWGRNFIKKVWREQMAIQGDYYRTLNIFLGWRYFGIENPRRYLKMIETKHIQSFL